MSTPTNNLHVASITDRGLSQKRPLNEDSFLADGARGIFAVADGVGGAEAGEVASKTAVEVLDEAFRHRVGDGEDVEDLMELAIQRANNSIHQMAAELSQLSMMATTIVALHVDGLRATIGHVGDSRLYRVSPDGTLHRETKDHSVVEEEVRAGRMTPEQAANHPSKNVISRALGAEETVEVDLKSIEVVEGTTFLLCSDGITRHIPDKELRGLLVSDQTPEAVCAELKERCYKLGAEDNLTAVIVQLGSPKYEAIDDERTVSTSRPTQPLLTPPAVTPSRIAVPAQVSSRPPRSAPTRKTGSPVLRFFVFLLFIAATGGAFYGGIKYQASRPSAAQPAPTPESSFAAAEVAHLAARSAVDGDPQKWLKDDVPIEMAKEAIAKPNESKDPEFLYLYGRALMLTGDHRGAIQAFDQALSNLRLESKGKLPFDVEVRLASTSAALKLKGKAPPSQETVMAEQKAMHTIDELLSLKSEAK